MKIFLAQQNYHIGNFELNAQKIIEGIKKGKEAGADLVLFSELCICGYPPRDFLEFNDFINQCYQTIDVIKGYEGTGLRGIFHCFGGSDYEAQQIIQMGFLLGIGGVLTYKKSGLAEVLKDKSC